MKNKIISILSLFIVVLALFGFSYAHKQPLIKQKYIISEVHNDYVIAESTQFKNEYIAFYYDDMNHKQKIKLKDHIIALFSKDKHNNNHIEDWHKIN